VELGTLEPTVNLQVVEKALELSIKSLHGRRVDAMEVKALTELANKTMSKFQFKLPKNLALYIRMSSILEGIYYYHGVRFQFVKVLANMLEREGLVRAAYIEEAKSYFNRIGKSIDSFVEIGPILKSYLERNTLAKSQNNYGSLPAVILASSVFIGSSIMLVHNSNIAYAGFVGAFIIGLISVLHSWKTR
jgi:predicted unusual protein kinase regulating ubiquinone biosynthesis (AarF/ABC1/UbiB family)